MDEKYDAIVDMWRSLDIKDDVDLARALEGFSVDFAYNTARIENDKVTRKAVYEAFQSGDIEGLDDDVRTLNEILNLATAHERLLEAFSKREPITEAFILDVQKIITMGAYDQKRFEFGERPGEYKHNYYVVGKGEVGASPEDSPVEIGELLADLDSETIDEKNVLTAAAFLHAKFENIHPFADGNGRTGRFLMNYFLLLHNHPPIIVFADNKKAYNECMAAWDQGEDLKPLREFLKMQAVKTWEDSLA